MLNMVMLAVASLSRRTRPSFLHKTRGVGRPVTVQFKVTLSPGSASPFGEIQWILGKTEGKVHEDENKEQESRSRKVTK